VLNQGFECFQVDWTKVADLVQSRRVYIKAGKAYVPSSSELSLVLAEFSSRLSKALEMTAKALPRLDEDDRLLPVLEHLSMGFQAGITSDYTVNEDGEGVRAEQVPELANQSFPMCMRALQDTLKASKHLKHEGRQQYGLFLKVSNAVLPVVASRTRLTRPLFATRRVLASRSRRRRCSGAVRSR